MKRLSRLGGALVILALAACGAEGERVDEQAEGMKVLLPFASPLPKGAADPAEDAPEPEDGAPDEVRETGFAPDPEDEAGPGDDCIDCVRETGFVPAPVLELLVVEAHLARVRWTVDASVTRVRLDGTRYTSDGLPAESFEQVVVGYDRTDIALDGRRTIVTVTAIDEGGKARSKQSNAIDLPGR